VFGWYNAYTHADAYGTIGSGPMSNASIFMHIPQKDSYVQTGDRERQYSAYLENKNYIAVYMGDYDGAAWTNSMLISQYLNDPLRGALPLSWPIISNVADRVPHVINRMYEQATPNDYFVGGDNGYGYLHMSSFIDPNRPLGRNGRTLNGSLETFKTRTVEEFKKYDIDIMGFLLTTTVTPVEVENLFAEITPYGIWGNQKRDPARPVETLVDYKNTPDNYFDDVIYSYLDGGVLENTVASLRWFFEMKIGIPQAPTFTTLRIVSISPTTIYNTVQALSPDLNVEIVDPYTYGRLLKAYTIAQINAGGTAQ
jgi:hypothetical protein